MLQCARGSGDNPTNQSNEIKLTDYLLKLINNVKEKWKCNNIKTETERAGAYVVAATAEIMIYRIQPWNNNNKPE